MSGIVGIGGGGGGGTTPTLRFSVQGMVCQTSIGNITLLQDTGASFTVLNSSGIGFETNIYVLNSSGTPFGVPKDVLDSDGNSFTVT